MRPYTWLWIAWGVAFVLIEGWAIYRRVFEDTLTGHAVAAMRSSPWLMWLIPTLVVGLAFHLALEALRP